MKKIILLFIFFLNFCVTAKHDSLQKIIANYQGLSGIRCGTWSVYAEYVDTGEVIIDFNSHKALAAGSNIKLITGATALCLLGADYRFITNFYYDGDITPQGILKGNVYIVGSGDPTLASGIIKTGVPPDTLFERLCRELKERGIKRIEGGIIADNLLFYDDMIPEQWPWGYLGRAFAPATNAICVNENQCQIYFSPANKAGQTASILRVEPEIYDPLIINHLITIKDNIPFFYKVFASPLQDSILVYGAIPQDNNEYFIKAAISDPALLMARMISGALKDRGIIITQDARKLESHIYYDKEKRFLSLYSPPLKEIIYILNKKSINLYAEQLCKILGLRMLKSATTSAGIKAIKDFLISININIDCLRLFDGSGLSRTTQISPSIIVKLLTYMTGRSDFLTFYNSLSVAGDPEDIGFFSEFGAGIVLAKNAHIKSGTLEGVKAHSGYINTRSGRLISFSMIMNNFSVAPEVITAIHKELMIALAELP